MNLIHCPSDVRRLFLLQSNAKVFYHFSTSQRSISQLCRQEPYQEVNRQRLRKVSEDWFEFYFGLGTLWAVMSQTPDDEFDGPVKSYYDNGSLCIHQEYRNGRENGVCEEWLSDNIPVTRAFFVDDVMHDTSLEWFPNGQLRYKWQWHHGKRHGLFESWDDEGNLVLQEEWEHGVRTKINI